MLLCHYWRSIAQTVALSACLKSTQKSIDSPNILIPPQSRLTCHGDSGWPIFDCLLYKKARDLSDWFSLLYEFTAVALTPFWCLSENGACDRRPVYCGAGCSQSGPSIRKKSEAARPAESRLPGSTVYSYVTVWAMLLGQVPSRGLPKSWLDLQEKYQNSINPV